MAKFIDGVKQFRREVFPVEQELFQKLAGGQSPDALFITCSDSRIETGMLTQSKPGDLFVCRNAGNIVPPHEDGVSGMSATIEYAMRVLQVPHIVVCGHSGCGAMGGVMDPDSVAALPLVAEWLTHARDAKAALDMLGKDLPGDERMQRLTEMNVVLQLNHLRTHPSVADRLAKNEVTLHGWVYDIGTGRVAAYAAERDAFAAFEDIYPAD